MKRYRSYVLSVLIVAVFLAAWELSVRAGLVKSFFVSRPSLIFGDLVKIVSTGMILPHIAVTLEETFLGLAIGTASGIAIALFFDRFEILGSAFNPIFAAVNGLPKLALAPIFILIFGLGVASKVVISSMLVFFLVFFNTYGGLKSIDPVLPETIRLMGGKDYDVMRKVSLPACVPWILAGLHGGLGIAIGGAIVGEYMGASVGLGYVIEWSAGMFQMTRLMSCMVILVVIIAVLYGMLAVVERRLLRWRPNK